MISANGGLPAHRYTPQVTPRWPRGSELASAGCRGPLPSGCGCGGVRAWGPVTNPTARALASWLCALWGRHEGARGGRLLPGCGASGVGRSPTPDCPPSGRAAGAHYPMAVGAGSWLCALWGRHEGARGGRLLRGCGASGVGRSPTLDCPPSGRAAGAHYPLAVGAGGCGRGDPSPTPQRALLRAGFARCGGSTRAPGGGRLLPGCGASGVGRSPTPNSPPSGWAAAAHYPLAVGAGGCGRGDPSSTPQRALFPAGFARCGGGMRVPGGGRLLPGCGASGVGRSPTPDCPPSGQAAGAHYPLAVGAGGRGRGDPSPTPQRALLRAGFARCGFGMRVPGGGASCLGVGRPGSGALPPPTARPSGGLPGCCACACPAWPGRAGRASVRVLLRLTFLLAFLASLFACSAPSGLGLPCLWLLLGFFVFFSFCCFSPSPPRCAPVVSCSACFPAPGALGLGVLPPPPPPLPPFFFPPPRLCAPLSPALRVFRPGVPWALASCCPPPSFFFLPPPPPLPVVSGVSCFPVAFGLSPPPFFFSCPAAFFPAARLLCVFWGVVLCVPCPARLLCCARRLCCFWWLVLLVPGVAAFCWGSAGGSGCPALTFGGVCRLWCPCLVWPSLGVLPVVSRSPVLCPVALCCRVVPCCRALSFFFVFLPAGGAGFLLFPVGSGLRAGSGSFLFLCSACAVLCWRACAVALYPVLSCPRGAGWCFVLLPVVFVCLLLGLAVLCCLLVGPGGSWCRVSVACCGVSLPAVLRRVAVCCAAWRCVVVRCVVSFCSVWCCSALCCVPGRCPSSWGPVPSGAVFCLVLPRCVCFAVACRCVVLFAVVLCAVCALGCPVVRFLSSPPCAVLLCGPLSLGALLPCAVPRGAVLPRGGVVSCPAALFGLFLAWVWLYLLEKRLQNFVKYFFPLFLAFENKKKLYTTRHACVQQDHVRCCALRATRRS